MIDGNVGTYGEMLFIPPPPPPINTYKGVGFRLSRLHALHTSRIMYLLAAVSVVRSSHVDERGEDSVIKW